MSKSKNTPKLKKEQSQGMPEQKPKQPNSADAIQFNNATTDNYNES